MITGETISNELYRFIGICFGITNSQRIKKCLTATMEGKAKGNEIFESATVLEKMLYISPNLTLTMELERIKHKAILSLNE